MSRDVIRAALTKGPMVGKELYRATGLGIFELWRLSHLRFKVLRVGRRYLRFDKNVEGYARLSPAIEREFITYSVVGLKEDAEAITARAKALEQEIKDISGRKMKLAGNVVKRAAEGILPKGVCFVIGGDVPLGMAHADPRPESDTGELIAGSDLDVVVIVSDDLPQSQITELDERLYKEKFRLLKNAHRKEELDYLVKKFSKVLEQARFDSFENMIACKILHEGKLLHGDRELYESVLRVLDENGIPARLKKLERVSTIQREKAEDYLLKKGTIDSEEYMKLFTTSEEFGEIF